MAPILTRTGHDTSAIKSGSRALLCSISLSYHAAGLHGFHARSVGAICPREPPSQQPRFLRDGHSEHGARLQPHRQRELRQRLLRRGGRSARAGRPSLRGAARLPGERRGGRPVREGTGDRGHYPVTRRPGRLSFPVQAAASVALHDVGYAHDREAPLQGSALLQRRRRRPPVPISPTNFATSEIEPVPQTSETQKIPDFLQEQGMPG